MAATLPATATATTTTDDVDRDPEEEGRYDVDVNVVRSVIATTTAVSNLGYTTTVNIYYNCKIIIIEKSGLSVDSSFLGVILKRRVYIKQTIS